MRCDCARSIALAEALEDGAVVRPSLVTDDVRLRTHAVYRADEVLVIEEPGDLVDLVDERERPNARELCGEGMRQHQPESSEARDRARDVAEHHQLRSMRVAVPERRIEGDTSG